MTVISIGMVELTSIAKGFLAADAMLKAADVELLMNRSICPGKFMIAVAGEVAAVEAAVAAGVRSADHTTVDSFVIPHIDSRILPAISGTNEPVGKGALGIIETFSVASCIEAADAALKAADVDLIQLHLAMA
ncbi:MAG: BMC domain-containing protein, partial [Candidatus Marinimicrobia bacterium]|nr:BMC domain-containing protein [Candidatus Neomarinimicrobiota bacterium]